MASLRALSVLLLSKCLPGSSALVPTGPICNRNGMSSARRLLSSTLSASPSRVGAGDDTLTLTNRALPAHGSDLQMSELPSMDEPSSAEDGAVLRRRRFLVCTSRASIFATLLPGAATAIDNPLNLKGYLWETGKPYVKSNDPLPDGDDDFLAILDGTAEALHSETLTEAISEGKYGQASRLLRGGLISESKIRIAANALIDGIPEENDEAIYKSSEAFRIFLQYLDVLDAEVEAASRPSFGGGGEGDPRMKILTRLGEAEDAMRAFLRNVRSGLGVKGK